MANTIQIGADTSGFVSGINRAQTSMAGLGSMIQRVVGGATVFSGLAAAAKGFFAAIQAGDDLVDLNAQTGVAVDKLMELQMAFDLNGMKAEQVQPVLAKLQKSISEAASGSADAAAKFALMGVQIKDIQGLSADEQLAKVGKAISKIENPAQRSAMAMDIFGKQGAKLLSVFSTGGMDEVRKVLGNQSALMLENAGIFGKASDILGLAGSKVRGFFVGIASEIVPQLMDVLDKAANLDFSKVGQGVGKEINMFVAAAQQVFVWMAKLADLIVSAFSTAANILFAPALLLGKLLGGDRGPSGQQEGAPETKDTYLSRAMAEIEEDQKKAREKNKTPGAADTGAGYIPKTGGGGPLGMADISSLQKVGGGSALLSGGQDNSPAYQSVRIQEDIRDYIKDLIQTVKEGGQSYQISPNTSAGMVLTA